MILTTGSTTTADMRDENIWPLSHPLQARISHPVLFWQGSQINSRSFLGSVGTLGGPVKFSAACISDLDPNCNSALHGTHASVLTICIPYSMLRRYSPRRHFAYEKWWLPTQAAL